MILSTEVNSVVSARAEKLKIPCRQGCENKASALHEICAEYVIDRSAVAFVGNDLKLIYLEDLFSPDCHPLQLVEVSNLVGYIVIDDQVIFSVYADLDVISNLSSMVLAQRHGSAVGVGEGNLGFV